MDKDVLFSIIGLSAGMILIDFDHLLDRAYFHWFPVVLFLVFFGLGLFIWGDRK